MTFRVGTILALLLAAGPWGSAEDVVAPGADFIIQRVNTRDDGDRVTRTQRLTLTDKDGKALVRETFIQRKDYEGERRSVGYFLKPAKLRNMGLLTIEYDDPDRRDDQWAYLPAMRKVRRVPAAKRGDYVQGMDFTFEDIKHEGRIPTEDYYHTTTGVEEIDGRKCYILDCIPVDEEIAKELGYSRMRIWVDAEIWYPRRVEFDDVSGAPLKTVRSELRETQGIWYAYDILGENLQTGHTTRVETIEVDYETPIADDTFTERALKRGVRSQ